MPRPWQKRGVQGSIHADIVASLLAELSRRGLTAEECAEALGGPLRELGPRVPVVRLLGLW
ncbi:MAG: hypothetical protein KF782_31360, partial [Labilithrix sp.]|nr:hypothetical protein [Labilithrix sp.]